MLTQKQMNAAFPCTVTAGMTDRGNLNSPFEAVSFNSRKGEYLRTRHGTRAKAMKRLAGNVLHSERSMTDYTDDSKPVTVYL